MQSSCSFIRWFLLGFGGDRALRRLVRHLQHAVDHRRAADARARRRSGRSGGSRRQVLRSVLLEALAIGAIASVLGLCLGVALAHGLKRLFAALGLDLPSASMTLAPTDGRRLAARGHPADGRRRVVPARRATRVAPIAAMRDGAAGGGPGGAAARSSARCCSCWRWRCSARGCSSTASTPRRGRSRCWAGAVPLPRDGARRVAARQAPRRDRRRAVAQARRRGRPARRRERAPEPVSHGGDGSRADGRARARHIRDSVRQGPERLRTSTR